MPEGNAEHTEFEQGVSTIMQAKNLGREILAMEIAGRTGTDTHNQAVEHFRDLSHSVEILELTSPMGLFGAMRDEAQRRIVESLRDNGGNDA